jgi:predicted nucleic acid-binding Zn ribbon protein
MWLVVHLEEGNMMVQVHVGWKWKGLGKYHTDKRNFGVGGRSA